MDFAHRFQNIKVIVVGDLMLDRYWWGNASRISPEAPVPVVRLDRQTVKPGGAANVAANIAGLNAIPFLVGITGDDDESRVFMDVLSQSNIDTSGIVTSSDRKTTVKTRIIAHGQQVARVDQESDHSISEQDEAKILEKINGQLKDSKALIISDYAKGLFTTGLLDKIIKASKNAGVFVLVDPKGKDHSKYSGADLLTPNKKETIEAAGIETNVPEAELVAGKVLIDALNIKHLLVTRGEDGMALFGKDEDPIYFDSLARQVYDVTGAGDTVIATLGVAVAAGLKLADAAELANKAAGIVVGQVGTTAVKVADLDEVEIET